VTAVFTADLRCRSEPRDHQLIRNNANLEWSNPQAKPCLGNGAVVQPAAKPGYAGVDCPLNGDLRWIGVAHL
jgi:hypothetical protein